MARLKLENLSKRFGEVRAINGLSLEIRDREFFVLLGPTGAGKSTLLRCIAGLERPETGDVVIDDDRVNEWSAAQRDVALVFQQYSLYPNYTVRENLEFPLKSRMRRTPPDDIARRVQKAAETVRITHLLDRRTDRLSGGEMQRVSIGRAIVREPRVFLMDEPLSNLDAKLRELLRAELKDLQLRLGATLVFVTHDQVEAMTMGDRIGVLRHGQLVQVGTPHEIYNAPANTFVAAFVGSPSINLIAATVQSGRAVALPGAFEFELGDAFVERVAHAVPADRKVQIGVRPENVQLVEGAGIAGTVYGVENQGVETIVTVDIAGQRLRATVPSVHSIKLNQPVRVALDPQRLLFFDPVSGGSLLDR